MVALTRIRCEDPENFVISATSDPLAEIAVLDLPAHKNSLGLWRDTNPITPWDWRKQTIPHH
jgi:hypothetical protein